MLDLLVFAVVAAVAPAPTASATPAPVLTEIAHVHSTSPACAELVTHANAAIGTALGNDDVLNRAIHSLQTVDLEGNSIMRRNSLEQLGELADHVNDRYRTGNGEVQRLRAIAANAPTPAGKAELLSFANWLGGALWRQKTIARDLDGFIATMDAKDMATFDESQQQASEGTIGQSDPRISRPYEFNAVGPLTATGPKLAAGNAPPMNDLGRATDDQLAAAAARDFLARTTAITNDEAMAADHVIGATSGC
jgi:hypothetical protein